MRAASGRAARSGRRAEIDDPDPEPGGDRRHDVERPIDRRVEIRVVQSAEEANADPAEALVAIDERLVGHDRMQQGGRLAIQVGIGVLATGAKPAMPRAWSRGLLSTRPGPRRETARSRNAMPCPVHGRGEQG